MAERDLWIRIKADIGSLMSGLSKASSKVADFDKQLAKNAAKRQALDDLGKAYRNVALGAAAGLAAVVKTAMDWETAWAGVTKTVDGTAEELATIEKQLRDMATSMPATHQEIAAVAQAAGALGVATPDVVEFSRVMIMLGEATDDLTSEQAATSIAQMTNVMKTAPEDVDNLAAALVALGNNGASTEGQIIQMAQALSGAGKTVGLTESDVLGIANAMASVGIEAEAGGSSVSRILMDMSKAAKTGSEEVKLWAKTSGMSVQDFTKAMEKSPARAFDAFTKGLGKINKDGGDVYTLLDKLGQSDIRVTRALLNMAGAGDLLSDSLKMGKQAWKDNTALTDEYGKRVETAAAQMQIAWNGIKDNLIDIGADALPVVKELSQAVSDLTGMFSDLPKPVQGGIVKILALTAALAGGMYVVTKARTGFAGLGSSFEASGKAAEGAGRKYALMRGGMGAAGIAALGFKDAVSEMNAEAGEIVGVLGSAAVGFAVGGPWGAAVGAGASLIKSFADANKNAIPDIDALTASLNQQTGALTANSRQLIVDKLNDRGEGDNQESIADKARRMKVNLGDLTDAAVGDKAALWRITQMRERVAKEQAAIAEQQSPGSGGATYEGIKRNFDELTDSITAQGGAIGKARSQLDNLNESQAQSKAMNALTADQVTRVTKAVRGLPKKAATELTTPGYAKAKANIVDIAQRYNLTPEVVRTTMEMLDFASADIENVRQRMDEADRATARPEVKLSGLGAASAGIGTLIGQMDALDGKHASPSVGVSGLGGALQGLANLGGKIRNLPGVTSANGNLLDFYANGGMRENHVAQIAPAGAWRVWAEPETGGEAYIPFAKSKQKRSLEIWAQAGQRLGVNAHANGSIGGGSGTKSTAPIPGAYAIKITNWKTGEGRMTAIADSRVELGIASNENHKGSERRAGRR